MLVCLGIIGVIVVLIIIAVVASINPTILIILGGVLGGCVVVPIIVWLLVKAWPCLKPCLEAVACGVITVIGWLCVQIWRILKASATIVIAGIGWLCFEAWPTLKERRQEAIDRSQDRREERNRVAEARRWSDRERRMREAGPVGVEAIV